MAQAQGQAQYGRLVGWQIILFELLFQTVQIPHSSAYTPAYPPAYNPNVVVVGGGCPFGGGFYGGSVGVYAGGPNVGGVYDGTPYAGMVNPAMAQRMDQERQANRNMITGCIVFWVCCFCCLLLAPVIVVIIMGALQWDKTSSRESSSYWSRWSGCMGYFRLIGDFFVMWGRSF